MRAAGRGHEATHGKGSPTDQPSQVHNETTIIMELVRLAPTGLVDAGNSELLQEGWIINVSYLEWILLFPLTKAARQARCLTLLFTSTVLRQRLLGTRWLLFMVR